MSGVDHCAIALNGNSAVMKIIGRSTNLQQNFFPAGVRDCIFGLEGKERESIKRFRKPVLYPAELRDRALNTWIIEGSLATPQLDRRRARIPCGRIKPPPLTVKASRAAAHRAAASGRRLGHIVRARPLSAAIAQLKEGDALVHGPGLLARASLAVAAWHRRSRATRV